MKQLVPPILRSWGVKQQLMILIWGIPSLYESIAINTGMQDALRGKYPDGSLADFFIYHYGDFNNSWLMVLLIDALLSYFVKSKLVRLSIASLVTMAVFLVIEASDLPDVPAAFAGVVLYIAFSPKGET